MNRIAGLMIVVMMLVGFGAGVHSSHAQDEEKKRTLIETVQQEMIEKTAQKSLIQDRVDMAKAEVENGENTLAQLQGQIAYMRGLVQTLKAKDVEDAKAAKEAAELAEEEQKKKDAGIIPDNKDDGQPNK